MKYSIFLSVLCFSLYAMEEKEAEATEIGKDPYIYIVNSTPTDVYLRVRTGQSPNIKRIFPFSKLEAVKETEKFQIPLPKLKGGSQLPSHTGEKNPETFLFPKKTIFRIKKSDVTLPLRVRIWHTHYFPAVDVDEKGVPTETGEENYKASIASMLIQKKDLEGVNTIILSYSPFSKQFFISLAPRLPADVIGGPEYVNIQGHSLEYVKIGE